MDRFILSIDQSTSSTKAILFDNNARLVSRHNADHHQYYPQSDWVEHDPVEILNNTLKVIDETLKENCLSPNNLAALSITNQRETVVIWDINTGVPVYNAIVWQCKRAEQICKSIAQQGYGSLVKDKTGLVLSPYFSAAKAKWILDNVEGARQKAENGELLLGTIDSWLIWNLTGKKVHATDFSNACRTQLFNIKELKWDEKLLEIFTIPKTMLPKVLYSDEHFGDTTFNGAFDKSVPISGVIGDSHAALFGQNCFEKGMAKVTYGTGSSIMMNIGNIPLCSNNGLVTSVAWGIGGDIEYVFEGNINCTGATIKWLVDSLEIIGKAGESERLSSSVEGTHGVYFVPAFVGLGSPYWDSEAKASITGITLSTSKSHIVRAAEESIAYQIRDVLDIMVVDADLKLKEIKVDGGAIRDAFLMQFQADMLNTDVVCAAIEELSAYGSFLIAGLAVGFWNSKEEAAKLKVSGKKYKPLMTQEKRSELYEGWKKAVERTLS